MAKNLDLSLYLILDPPMCGGFEATLAVAEQALVGGVSMVQLRAPTWKKKAWYELALALKPVCHHYHAPLIINDHIDIALAVDADGVHIGQQDMPVAVVRNLLGQEKIVGLSVTNEEEMIQVNDLPVDYVGIGPIFGTATKPDAADAIGFEYAQTLVQKSLLPSVLIGGLKIEHIWQVRQTGSHGICVVSAICAASSPETVARNMKKQWSVGDYE